MRLDHPELRTLSEREREILSELAASSRVSSIATRLFISPHSVQNHLEAIYRKLGVGSQAELIERRRGAALRTEDLEAGAECCCLTRA